jgi:hypothetical protein
MIQPPPQDSPRRAPQGSLSISETLSDAWRLYSRHLPELFLLAAIGFGVIAIVSIASEATGARVDVGTIGSQTLSINPVAVVAIVLVVPWIQGALAIAARILQRDRRGHSLGAVFEQLEPSLWRTSAAGILQAVGVAIGLYLLIVPGLVLLTWWCLVIPAVVLERRDVVTAFRRSHRLVHGDAWRVFVVVIVTALLAGIVFLVLQVLLSPIGGAVGLYVSQALAGAVTTPFLVVSWTTMYTTLRLNRDGV